MCDRCESNGVLSNLLMRAGVIAPQVGLPVAFPAPTEGAAVVAPAAPAKPARRRRLWELEEKHHCPVIGTCITLDELKKLSRKCGFDGAGFDAYRLHVEAVSISCTRNPTAEAMQRLLEQKFRREVAEFDKAQQDAEVLALWKASLDRGEVAGPMWAAMTHKAASRETRHAVYADVHMLSHQVGAGQAADLRQLEWLRREHAALQAAHAALKTREAQGADICRNLERRLDEVSQQAQHHAEQAGLLLERVRMYESGQAMVALGRRLLLAEAQAARVTETETRLKALEERVAQLRAEKQRLKHQFDEVSAERDALERLWPEQAPDGLSCAGDCELCEDRLRGACVLCVGGRQPLLPQYRQLAERLGVRLIHHDGGREDALARLPDLLNASDAVICPTDCVGHLAYYQLKKHCKQSGKPCVLTPNSGVAGFAAALARLADGHADIRAQT